jgi:hypothetical protein
LDELKVARSRFMLVHFSLEITGGLGKSRMASTPRVSYIVRMTDALKKLLDAAKTAEPTPEQREQQRRSFVYGNTHFENSLITREMVDREAEKLAREKK